MTLAAAYEMTTGRLWSLIGVVFGLAGLVLGVLARRRGGRGVPALAAGAVGVVLGLVVVLMADGGPGTGYGIVGGYVSLVIGLAAVAVGGAVTRGGARAGARRAG
ncbi:DUF6223 family protein [Lentzea sp. NPDC060358]|uniref:DUF6223 family protein n=1 Tax=Lentzea sp. NPDC060358 TaxID=3347103 RepID=UPI003657A8CA